MSSAELFDVLFFVNLNYFIKLKSFKMAEVIPIPPNKCAMKDYALKRKDREII